MAKTKKQSRIGSPRKAGNGTRKDAIALLKADHRQVEEWFGEFEEAKDSRRKVALAKQICNALTVHAQIEEEIFYPAFLQATGDEDMHHEAAVEHAGAKRLIADIESKFSDEYFDARVTVLSEMIKHHVKEEEKPDGIFAKARKSDLDLVGIGEQLQARKSELEADVSLLGKTKKFFAAA
jgi:hemerythrin superfamily protein